MNRQIFKNWDIRRVLFLLAGIFFAVTAFQDQAWWMAIFGLYFIAKAVFRFGCASGNCEVNFDSDPPERKTDT